MRAAFVELRKAWEEFHSAYGAMDGAICDGGTGCSPILEEDDLQFTVLWLAALKDIEAGTAPATHADAAKFSILDRELNEKYRASFKFYTENLSAEGGIAPALCEADRKWLVYREAWVRFGALRWPDLPNICSDRRGYDPQKLPPKRRISRIRAYGRAQLNPFVTRSNPE